MSGKERLADLQKSDQLHWVLCHYHHDTPTQTAIDCSFDGDGAKRMVDNQTGQRQPVIESPSYSRELSRPESSSTGNSRNGREDDIDSDNRGVRVVARFRRRRCCGGRNHSVCVSRLTCAGASRRKDWLFNSGVDPRQNRPVKTKRILSASLVGEKPKLIPTISISPRQKDFVASSEYDKARACFGQWFLNRPAGRHSRVPM